MNYYNEFDPLKAEVIREAIKAGAIAPGDVDERSISDVPAAELRGYTQCHFFAGGGFWSLALRLAGWPDSKPVWTGSCPCPSFSAAGKGGGFDDARHLWPDWFKLIRECRPPVLFGEQADDAIGYGWLDLVQANMEAEAYAVGAVVFGAHSVGAPHIRQRLYFCADTKPAERRPEREVESEAYRRYGPRRGGVAGLGPNPDGGQSGDGNLQRGGEQRLFAADRGAGDSADATNIRFESVPEGRGSEALRCEPQIDGRKRRAFAESEGDSAGGGHNPISTRLQGLLGDVREWRGPGWLDPLTARSIAEAGATRGFWADCDWWYGRDGKYRPIGPGLFPLAHGHSAAMVTVGSVEKEAWEEVKRYANECETNTGKVLRMVRDFIQQEASREGQQFGVREQLSTQTFLLAFLLRVESAFDPSGNRQCLAQENEDHEREYLRLMRIWVGIGDAPYRRRSAEQCAAESTNPVRLLSRVLSRHAEAHRAAYLKAHVAANRVSLLRLAGDAVVVTQAQEFIEAYQEATFRG